MFQRQYLQQVLPKRHGIRQMFSPEEDEMLKLLVKKFGDKDWKFVAKKMPGRTTRQCRERYKSYLAPDIKNGPWTEEEDELLKQKYDEFGPKWAKIASFFKSRSDINIKNRWSSLTIKERHKAEKKAKISQMSKQNNQNFVNIPPLNGFIQMQPYPTVGYNAAFCAVPHQQILMQPLPNVRQTQQAAKIIKNPINLNDNVESSVNTSPSDEKIMQPKALIVTTSKELKTGLSLPTNFSDTLPPLIDKSKNSQQQQPAQLGIPPSPQQPPQSTQQQKPSENQQSSVTEKFVMPPILVAEPRIDFNGINLETEILKKTFPNFGGQLW